ncbi:hypothetical protein PAHAL_8G081300 [Panicum hallii]|uniref:Serpin domain-containing protein n=1 Tax=Panicum hallii TaxID=206008 RepID=A0A2T8I871_9POAL|nr:putative serpin-Z5 [Panicum hallii]PVH33876.1 hypothetical protein PAHAL_8G081300 [Panicum hallii]
MITVNVVVNAIYFKGEWSDPFKKENTIDGEFRRLDCSSIDVSFMRSWSHQQIACHEGFKVLKLPYKVMDEALRPGLSWKKWDKIPKFCMCVFLPDANDGPWSLVERMASSPEFLHVHLPMKSVPVGKFWLPRFKLSFGGSIIDDLKSLDLILPFDPFMASMTEMVKDEATEGGMYIDNVIHTAVIEVNEEGSVAAASTESDDDMGFS